MWQSVRTAEASENADEALQKGTDEKSFLTSTCFHLAHMAEPLGETVAGMCTWDASRLIDYVYERGEWDTDDLGVVGFPAVVCRRCGSLLWMIV